MNNQNCEPDYHDFAIVKLLDILFNIPDPIFTINDYHLIAGNVCNRFVIRNLRNLYRYLAVPPQEKQWLLEILNGECIYNPFAQEALLTIFFVLQNNPKAVCRLVTCVRYLIECNNKGKDWRRIVQSKDGMRKKKFDLMIELEKFFKAADRKLAEQNGQGRDSAAAAVFDENQPAICDILQQYTRQELKNAIKDGKMDKPQERFQKLFADYINLYTQSTAGQSPCGNKLKKRKPRSSETKEKISQAIRSKKKQTN